MALKSYLSAGIKKLLIHSLVVVVYSPTRNMSAGLFKLWFRVWWGTCCFPAKPRKRGILLSLKKCFGNIWGILFPPFSVEELCSR